MLTRGAALTNVYCFSCNDYYPLRYWALLLIYYYLILILLFNYPKRKGDAQNILLIHALRHFTLLNEQPHQNILQLLFQFILFIYYLKSRWVFSEYFGVFVSIQTTV